MLMGRTVDQRVLDAWRVSLAAIQVKHLDPAARPRLVLSADGHLHVGCGNVTDTSTGARRDLPICSVRLEYHPGDDTLARQWFAAAWAGYQTHEALEIVKHQGRAVLDPHAEPYPDATQNRGLKDGFPSVLTRDAFFRTLCVVMDPADAAALMEGR